MAYRMERGDLWNEGVIYLPLLGDNVGLNEIGHHMPDDDLGAHVQLR